MKYVIIGNSTAAVGCIEGIRSHDKDGEITVISNENHHTYSRPLISYLLYGKTDTERMKYRGSDFYGKNKVKTILGENVVKIDAKNKCAVLENGETEAYDKIMIATGSSPFVPPMKGLENVEKKFTFMTLDDAQNLEKVLTSDAKTVIIGAGLIGLKAAEGIADRVGKITVVDMADRILPSILDEQGSAMIKKYLEDKKGIEFKLNTCVSEFDGNTAILANGEKVDFDIVIIAVGVRPNTSLAKDAGAEVNRGIVCSSKQETTLKDVYTAGDCCESFDISCGENRILALLPNAYMQGFTAGVNMSGGEAEFNNAIPMNAIGFFGNHIITAGSYIGESYTEIGDNTYKKLFFKDNLLKGFILIGDIKCAGIYTSLIREQIPLDTIDFEAVKKQPGMYAFPKARRDEKLRNGGI